MKQLIYLFQMLFVAVDIPLTTSPVAAASTPTSDVEEDTFGEFQSEDELSQMEVELAKLMKDQSIDDSAEDLPVHDRSTWTDEDHIVDIFELLCKVKLATPLDIAHAMVIAEEARTSSDGAELDAERFAGNVHYPPEFYTRDVDALKDYTSLAEYARSVQTSTEDRRFNVARFMQMFKDDPECDRLYDIAFKGANIHTAGDFVACATPSPRRQIYDRIPCTFKKHCLDAWESKEAIVLPLSSVLHELPHSNDFHWIYQPNKPQGRILGDCTNKANGNALNNIDAKEAIIDQYGKLSMPTIIDIIQDALDVGEACGGLRYVRYLKEDVVGAFKNFMFDPTRIRLMGFTVDDDYILFYLVGMFGYSGCPFIFGVFTRAILRWIQKRIHPTSRAKMFCDDVMAFSGVSNAAPDQVVVVNGIEGAFGDEKACRKKKLLPSLQGDAIGWWLDLVLASLRPNDKGIRALTRAFILRDTNKPLSSKVWASMASLACRYSRGLKGMRGFVTSLFRMIRQGKNSASRPSAGASLCILVWRVVTLCLIVNPDSFAVSMHALVREVGLNPVSFISDAGPIALGLAIFNHLGACLGFVSYVLPFDASDPKYQNCREFMGHLLGKILIIMMGLSSVDVRAPTSLDWTGDNMSALSWVRKNACSSTPTRLAFLADCWLTTLTDVHTTSDKHKAGVLMGDIDGLSRLRNHEFDESLNLKHLLSKEITELFVICDPTIAEDKDVYSLPTLLRIMAILLKITKKSTV